MLYGYAVKAHAAGLHHCCCNHMDALKYTRKSIPEDHAMLHACNTHRPSSLPPAAHLGCINITSSMSAASTGEYHTQNPSAA